MSLEMEKLLCDCCIFEGCSLHGVDIIDFVQGIKRYGSETAYIDVIRSYYVHTPPLLETLKTFSKEKTGIPLAKYAVTVHGIKGASSGIFAAAAAEKADELEKAAKKGDFEFVLTQNTPFIDLMESLTRALGELLEKAAAVTAKEKKPAVAPDPALLLQLLEAAKGYKTDKMEKIVHELESYTYNSGNELISWLRDRLDNLEYADIQERLESMFS